MRWGPRIKMGLLDALNLYASTSLWLPENLIIQDLYQPSKAYKSAQISLLLVITSLGFIG